MLVARLIRECNLNHPATDIIEHDSEVVIRSLKNYLINKSIESTSDEQYLCTMRAFYSGTIFPKTNEEVKNSLEHIAKTIKLELMQYSPEKNIFLSYVSSEISNKYEYKVCLVFLGLKENDKIKIYSFFKHPWKEISTTRSIAFNKVFKYLAVKHGTKHRLFPIHMKKFWTNMFLFERTNVDDDWYYGFQLQNWNKFSVPENDREEFDKTPKQPLITISTG